MREDGEGNLVPLCGMVDDVKKGPRTSRVSVASASEACGPNMLGSSEPAERLDRPLSLDQSLRMRT